MKKIALQKRAALLPVAGLGHFIGPQPSSFADCSADLDGDGVVGIKDVATQLSNYGIDGVEPEDGDLDGDGIIDLDDLADMLASFGEVCEDPNCVPAPPSNLLGRALDASSIALTWADNSSDEVGFYVLQRDGEGDPNSASEWQIAVVAGANSTSQVIAGLLADNLFIQTTDRMAPPIGIRFAHASIRLVGGSTAPTLIPTRPIHKGFALEHSQSRIAVTEWSRRCAFCAPRADIHAGSRPHRVASRCLSTTLGLAASAMARYGD